MGVRCTSCENQEDTMVEPRHDDGGENRTARSYRLLPVVTTALLVGVGIMLVIYLIARG
jgi:hypothetical protein